MRPPAIVLVLVLDHFLVERQALMMERVAHAVTLGPQVGLVVGVGQVLDRDLVGDRQAVALHARDLLGVVGQDADA